MSRSHNAEQWQSHNLDPRLVKSRANVLSVTPSCPTEVKEHGFFDPGTGSASEPEFQLHHLYHIPSISPHTGREEGGTEGDLSKEKEVDSSVRAPTANTPRAVLLERKQIY